jgi:hypothetical protein
MATTRKPNKVTETTNDNLLIAGIQKHLATATLTLAGTSYTGAALVALLQARVSAVSGTVTAKTAYASAVKAQDEELANTQAVVSALRKTILAMYKDAATLGDFGLSPPKKPSMTPAERVASAAKAAATRAARHTMGPEQKKAVTGASASASSSSSASGGSPTTAGGGSAPTGVSSPPAVSSPATSNGATTKV